ncbi:MAG: hypothetical protein JWR68_3311 [Polaromonas sp.]|nr:hypothetical protein [Polaromonas sp.]
MLPVNAQSETTVARLKKRLLRPFSRRGQGTANAETRLPMLLPPRQVGFPASIAEFLLVFRLKARRSSLLSTDILERAVRVVFITCKNWFGGIDAHKPPSRKHG